MNPATKSKINWTSLIIAVIGGLVAFDVLPQDIEQPVTEITMIVGPVLIATFRTWFTGGKS